MNHKQRGFFLIEAMLAVLIFSLGILGMVALGGTAMSAQSDARYRTDAATLASQIASVIELNVDRSSDAALATSLAAFQHLPGGTSCVFTGAAATDPAGLVAGWVDEVISTGTGAMRLPGAGAEQQQILVTTGAGGFNRVQVTVCWQAPSDSGRRQHTLVTFVNGAA